MGNGEAPSVREAMPSGEAARRLGVSNTTIVNWLLSGVLDGYSVPGSERRRHFVFVDSIVRLQTGAAGGATDSGADGEHDAWRARAARAETDASFLRAAFDELLGAYEDEQRAAARLRRAIEIQQRALDTHVVHDDELTR